MWRGCHPEKPYLGRGHKQVEVVCNLKVVGPAGDYRELDAVAFAGECVYVGELKNKMDSVGAEKLANTVDFIELRKNLGLMSLQKFEGESLASWALWRRRIPRIKN
ncbi:hypothetical protein Ndes2526A_g01322 [Nannochloris sp. 'desiccata']